MLKRVLPHSIVAIIAIATTLLITDEFDGEVVLYAWYTDTHL